MKDLKVIPIKKEETYPWLLKKHYAHRIPNIMLSYGLFTDNTLSGICTYGMPCRMLMESINCKCLELNRLFTEDFLPKNSTSYFVSQTFKYIKKPCYLVSYADKNKNHHGYIYQATNWIYTGLSNAEPIYVDKNDNEIHRRSANSLFGSSSEETLKKNGYEKIIQFPKFRYFMILANSKKQKKQMLKDLKYPILPYPKGDNKRYDSSTKIEIQQRIF